MSSTHSVHSAHRFYRIGSKEFNFTVPQSYYFYFYRQAVRGFSFLVPQPTYIQTFKWPFFYFPFSCLLPTNLHRALGCKALTCSGCGGGARRARVLRRKRSAAAVPPAGGRGDGRGKRSGHGRGGHRASQIASLTLCLPLRPQLVAPNPQCEDWLGAFLSAFPIVFCGPEGQRIFKKVCSGPM